MIDVAITFAVLVATLVMIGTGGFGSPDPGSRPLDGLGVILAVASAVPLVLRRVAPGTVYAVTAAASIVLLRLRYPLEVPFGAATAVYALAVAYGGHRARWRPGLAALGAVMFVPTVALVYRSLGLDVWGITPELVGWEAIFVGLWFAGDRARLQRQQMGHLRERAERSEREAEQDRRLAAAEERTRIARELHDSAGHAVNVILVQAGAARLLHDRDPEKSVAAITTIEAVARQTLNEIDRLVHALREDGGPEPSVPTDPAALTELVERHRAGGLRVNSDVTMADRHLPHSVAWAAYRILQEALNNAARHGRGMAEVAIRSGAGEVEITVTNPTTGAAARGNDRGGHGIVGMRERATLLGGTLHAAADAGVFRLHARLPYAGG